MQHGSNNKSAQFTDVELMTAYLWGAQQGLLTRKSIYNFIRTYHLGEFQKLPSYQAFCRRLNRLAEAFAALAEVLFEQKLASSEPTHGYVLDSCPVMVSVGSRSNTAKTARDLCNLTRNPTKNLWYHGVKLHVFAQLRPRISFPSPAPYRSAKPVSATCGLQSRSIWTAHRSQTAGSMQIVPISTQNGDPICKPSGTSRSSRRESGKSTMFLFPKMPCPPASVPCGSRLRSFSTGCRPKRTSSLLRTSVPAPVCSSTSSPPSLSPPSSCGSTIDSHLRGELFPLRRGLFFYYKVSAGSPLENCPQLCYDYCA